MPHMPPPPPFAGLAAQYRQDLGDVAVLTPYKAQLAQLRRTFQQVG
jgi:Tfp pilus assembly protein PilO